MYHHQIFLNGVVTVLT